MVRGGAISWPQLTHANCDPTTATSPAWGLHRYLAFIYVVTVTINCHLGSSFSWRLPPGLSLFCLHSLFFSFLFSLSSSSCSLSTRLSAPSLR